MCRFESGTFEEKIFVQTYKDTVDAQQMLNKCCISHLAKLARTTTDGIQVSGLINDDDAFYAAIVLTLAHSGVGTRCHCAIPDRKRHDENGACNCVCRLST